MTLKALQARMAKLERRNPQLAPGLHRLTDEELDGLIDVLRQLEVGQSVEPVRAEWAAVVMQREGIVFGAPPA
jgi:hypothetical protein